MREIPDEVFGARNKLEELFLSKPSGEVVALAEGTLGVENIVGVGIGEKYTVGQSTGELCLKVSVVEKAKTPRISHEFFVPPELDGVKTDVDEVGEIMALQLRRRFRPSPGGVSVGHKDVTAGTLGCLVRRNEEIYFLSNNHVLANSNSGSQNDPILQPGPSDGGTPQSDVIGYLHEWIPIDFSGTNNVDAAIARFSDSWHAHGTPFILQIGEVRGVQSPTLGMIVEKMGRTTRHTCGKIDVINHTIRVKYVVNGTAKVAQFANQIQITSLQPGIPFSLGGDSGSLILDEDNFACGLLFAGSPGGQFAWANPINVVLDAFKVDIWSFPW